MERKHIEREFAVLKFGLMSGSINRRQFLEGAVALGISSTIATGALAETPKRGGHVIVGLNDASASDSLDPGTYTSFMGIVGAQLWDSLTLVNERSEVRPALAESWETKPGAVDWVFKLRRGVTFHNGKSFAAADVVHSLNHHGGKGSKSAARSLVRQIAEIKATGKHEVTIKLRRGNVDLPFLLSDYHLLIGPEGSDFKDGVGTGAYKLENFEPGVRLRVSRNTNDYRTDRGYAESVETVGINDSSARVNALLSGAVHLINKVSAKVAPTIEKNSQFQVFNVSGGAFVYYAMHLDAAPTDNLDLRLALKYAIDREAVLKRAFGGFGKVGNDHPIPSFDPYFASDIPQRPYDPDKAKFHYAKSGHSGPIVFSVSDVPSAGTVDMTQVVQANAANAGINLKVKRVPADGYYGTHYGKTNLMASYWAGRPTANGMFSVWLDSKAAWNDTRWRSPRFDELLAATRVELDNAKRKKMYREMQWMIHEQGGALVPVFLNSIDAAATKLKGFKPSPVKQMSNYRAVEQVWLDA